MKESQVRLKASCMDWLWYVLHIKVFFPGAQSFLKFLGNKGNWHIRSYFWARKVLRSRVAACRLPNGNEPWNTLMPKQSHAHLYHSRRESAHFLTAKSPSSSFQWAFHFFFYGIKQCALINWSHQEKEPIIYFIFKVLKNSLIRKMRISCTGQAEWKAKVCNL